MYPGVQYMFLYLFFNDLAEMFHSKSRTQIQPEQDVYIFSQKFSLVPIKRRISGSFLLSPTIFSLIDVAGKMCVCVGGASDRQG